MQGLLWLGSWGKLFCGGCSNTRAIARAMALLTVGLVRFRATAGRFISSATPYFVLRTEYGVHQWRILEVEWV
jgi:hypothetical protein